MNYLLIILLLIAPAKALAQEQDEDEFRSVLKLAQQGGKGAQDSVGVLYAEGRSVKKDSVEAVKWFQKSAEQGDILGACNLALHYARGEGIQKDTVLALKWMLVSHSLDGLKCFPDDFVDFLKPTRAQGRQAGRLALEFLKSHPELHNEFGSRPWPDEKQKPGKVKRRRQRKHD